VSAFLMPSLGADMEAGTLVQWRVAAGDTVARGDIVAEVDTDKGVIEIECFESGVVERLVVEPGAKVPVGTVLAEIRSTDQLPPHPTGGATAPSSAPAAAASVPASTAVPLEPPRPTPERRVRVSPLARKRAAEMGLDLSMVQGTGPGGAIQVADVERAEPKVGPPGPAQASPLDSMRRAIAAAMARSKREIPHYYLQTRIDMSQAQAWLRAQNQQRPIEQRLLPVVVLLKAVASALRDVPQLNGFWIDGEHRLADAIHVGFAIAMKGGGLLAPAIHDVDRRSCDELMADLRDLIPRARAGRLRSSEFTDGTITVTSLGDGGVESVLGVIYPPQVAIVGFGSIADQPWAEHGMVGVRPVITASLAADHRATDGHVGARFLDAVAHHLRAMENS